MIAAGAGILAWTLAEYLLHRFAFHRYARVTKSLHPRHHITPRALRYLFAQPIPVVGISLIILVGLVMVLGSATVALEFMAGFGVGYLCYETVHYRIHCVPADGWLLSKQRRAHFRHHFNNPMRNFGVTTPFWDWVFRTFERNRPAL